MVRPITPPPAGHIRIMLVTNEHDALAFLIRLDTMAKVSHAAIVLRDGSMVQAELLGVERQLLGYEDGSAARMFVDIPVSPEQEAEWEAFAIAKIGTPYDVAAIAGFATHTDMHTPGHVICSALVIDALRHIGIVDEVLFKADHQTSPSDVAVALSWMAKLCGFIVTPLG